MTITRSARTRTALPDSPDEAEASLASTTRKKRKTEQTPTSVKTSRFFQVVAASPVPKPSRPFSNIRYGLIQEEIQDNLFYLLVQSILWNQTWGRSARPVLDTILSLYPTPEKLAEAALSELTLIIHPIGLHNRRAKRLIDLAQVWLAAPPCKERRYRKVGYPSKHSGKDIKPIEVLSEVNCLFCDPDLLTPADVPEQSDEREGWEIAHLPGIGAYALDSYRIFHRDKLRGTPASAEPEWKRVVATDKELRAWLVWRWQQEGYDYGILTGKTTPISTQKEAELKRPDHAENT